MLVVVLAAAVAALVLTPVPAEADASRRRTSVFPESSGSGTRVAIDRAAAAVARDGSAVTAWWAVQRTHRGRTIRRGLRVALAGPGGRLGPPRTIARTGVAVVAAAAGPGGRALVVWTVRGRLRAALRSRAGAPLPPRDLGHATSDLGNELFALADPDGGWLVCTRGVSGLRVVRLTAGGLVREDRLLGRGQFGLGPDDPPAPAAVTADGRAWLAADHSRGIDGRGDAVTATWTAAPGGAFGDRTALADRRADGVRVVAGAQRAAAVSWTSRAGAGEAGPFRAPRIALGDAAGRLGVPFGPALSWPRRAFGAAAAPLGAGWLLTWQEKPAPAPFRRAGAVRGAVLRDGVLGPARTLVSDARAEEALATGLDGSRALLRYAVGRTVRFVLVDATGRPRELTVPPFGRAHPRTHAPRHGRPATGCSVPASTDAVSVPRCAGWPRTGRWAHDARNRSQ